MADTNVLLEQPPVHDNVIVGPQDLKMGGTWLSWILIQLIPLLQKATKSVALVFQAALHAALGATAVVPIANGPRYRISWYVQIIVADGAGSSVTVTIASTSQLQTIAQAGPAVTGDTVNTGASGSFIVTPDAGSLISVSTAYASTTPAKMGYLLSVQAEAMA